MADNSKIGINPHAARDVSTANASSDAVLGVLLIVVAALIPWYFELPLVFDLWSPHFNPLIVLPFVLAAIGIVMLVRSVRATIRERRFGWSTLAPPTARVGGLYRGTLVTYRDVAPTGDYKVTLKCLKRTRSRSDSEGRSRSLDKVLHKVVAYVPAAGKSDLGVPVEFMIPANMPRSGTTKKNPDGQVRWVMTISAPTRGVNYYARFPVQVS